MQHACHAEGRIEPSDGTLMCSYHGWRFQGDGQCTDIPQALDEKSNAIACANQRSCAIARPTKVCSSLKTLCSSRVQMKTREAGRSGV